LEKAADVSDVSVAAVLDLAGGDSVVNDPAARVTLPEDKSAYSLRQGRLMAALPELDLPTVTYLGHASVLVTLHQMSVLCDPIITDGIVDMKRPSDWEDHRVRKRFPLNQLPYIFAITLSHTHTDHFHAFSIVQILNRMRRFKFYSTHPTVIFVPEGAKEEVETRLAGQVPIYEGQVVELKWGERRVIWGVPDYGSKMLRLQAPTQDVGLQVTALPNQHWSWKPTLKTLLNSGEAAFASFMVRTVIRRGAKESAVNNAVVHFGDTGYGPFYREIGDAYGGEILLAISPIGNYEPRKFMRPWHQSPRDAVQAHFETGARFSMVMHFSTYAQTSTEGFFTPAKMLKEACRALGFSVNADGDSVVTYMDDSRSVVERPSGASRLVRLGIPIRNITAPPPVRGYSLANTTFTIPCIGYTYRFPLTTGHAPRDWTVNNVAPSPADDGLSADDKPNVPVRAAASGEEEQEAEAAGGSGASASASASTRKKQQQGSGSVLAPTQQRS
jgi:L-ascorbate metabolism protein UlaG (beta-lactamase superfamily)